MIDPTSKVVLDLAGSSLTFFNALIQVAGKKKRPKPPPPTLSAFIGALPGAAVSAADTITSRITAFRQNCISAGLDLGDNLGRQGSMLSRSGKRMRDEFPVKVEEIALQASIFLDDIATLARCFPRQPVDAAAKPPNEKKAELRKKLGSENRLGKIIDALQESVDDAREELNAIIGQR